MRIIFFDLDTLRADHLGCYGYERDTSNHIDKVAEEGVRFDNYYCPNAPCLPSRASLVSGKFGIINGVVGHDGTAADMRLEGAERGFKSNFAKTNLFQLFRRAGLKTVSINTFAERHSAFWFNAGLNEVYNIGKGGMEGAEEVFPVAKKWLTENADKDNWFLHINMWDAHTPYRAPDTYGNPYKGSALPNAWIDKKEFKKHCEHIGPHGANEINMWDDSTDKKYKRHPGSLANINDVKNFIDQYDTGIRYMDEHIGKLIEIVKERGVYEDTAFIITSDHGENLGELGIYGEHATADEVTCKIPMIIKWPGGKRGIASDGLHTNVDLIPTLVDLFGFEQNDFYDGRSYSKSILHGENCGADSVVLTQCAHVIQRSARFDEYLYIRTIHGGYHVFEDEMLFNIMKDPHETKNLAQKHPELCAKGAQMIDSWQSEYMNKAKIDVDPLWTVVKEGGPMHAKGKLKGYIKRLEETGRGHLVGTLKEKYKGEIGS